MVGFFVLAWIALVAILVLAPEVYTQTLQMVDGKSLAIEASLLMRSRRLSPSSWSGSSVAGDGLSG